MSTPSPQFSPTSWTVVVHAADSQMPNSAEALSNLCADYWHPLYFYVRRSGQSQENAADLIQSFFLKMFQTGFLKSADKSKGKFRTYMLTALKRFMINEWQAAQTKKRGGAVPHLSLDFDLAENLYSDDSNDGKSSDQTFDHAWAMEILEKAIARLEKEYSARNKSDQFHALKGFLPGSPQELSQETAAAELGININTLRSHVHRIRSRFKKTLRDTVQDTVESTDQIDDEIRYLISVLSR